MTDTGWQDISFAPKNRRIRIKTAEGIEIPYADWGLAFSLSSASKRVTWRNCKGGKEIINPTHWRELHA